jgi:hypothetical protein
MGIDRDDRVFDGAQRADRLANQVWITGRIDHVEMQARVIEMNDRGLDRMPVVLFLFIEIADARAVVDARLTGHGARFHKQMINERSFAGRPMSTNCDVANLFDFPRHDCSYSKP